MVHEVLTLASSLALLLQAAGREGTVTGTLTLNGVAVPIAHVYASAEPGFFDKQKEDVHVLLSDVALSDDTRADVFAMIKLAREGRASIVEVVIDASGTPISGSLFAKPFDGMVSAAGMHAFTRERFERSVIQGRLAVATPHTFNGVTYQYDATFTAPIPRPPSSEELAAALQSPAAVAAQAYIAAVRAGELAGFVATLSEAAARGYQTTDAAARVRELRDDMPADTRVVGLVPQTDGSVLVSLEGHRSSDRMAIGYTLRVVQENGVWKIAP